MGERFDVVSLHEIDLVARDGGGLDSDGAEREQGEGRANHGGSLPRRSMGEWGSV